MKNRNKNCQDGNTYMCAYLMLINNVIGKSPFSHLCNASHFSKELNLPTHDNLVGVSLGNGRTVNIFLQHMNYFHLGK